MYQFDKEIAGQENLPNQQNSPLRQQSVSKRKTPSSPTPVKTSESRSTFAKVNRVLQPVAQHESTKKSRILEQGFFSARVALELVKDDFVLPAGLERATSSISVNSDTSASSWNSGASSHGSARSSNPDSLVSDASEASRIDAVSPSSLQIRSPLMLQPPVAPIPQALIQQVQPEPAQALAPVVSANPPAFAQQRQEQKSIPVQQESSPLAKALLNSDEIFYANDSNPNIKIGRGNPKPMPWLMGTVVSYIRRNKKTYPPDNSKIPDFTTYHRASQQPIAYYKIQGNQDNKKVKQEINRVAGHLRDLNEQAREADKTIRVCILFDAENDTQINNIKKQNVIGRIGQKLFTYQEFDPANFDLSYRFFKQVKGPFNQATDKLSAHQTYTLVKPKVQQTMANFLQPAQAAQPPHQVMDLTGNEQNQTAVATFANHQNRMIRR